MFFSISFQFHSLATIRPPDRIRQFRPAAYQFQLLAPHTIPGLLPHCRLHWPIAASGRPSLARISIISSPPGLVSSGSPPHRLPFRQDMLTIAITFPDLIVAPAIPSPPRYFAWPIPAQLLAPGSLLDPPLSPPAPSPAGPGLINNSHYSAFQHHCQAPPRYRHILITAFSPHHSICSSPRSATGRIGPRAGGRIAGSTVNQLITVSGRAGIATTSPFAHNRWPLFNSP